MNISKRNYQLLARLVPGHGVNPARVGLKFRRGFAAVISHFKTPQLSVERAAADYCCSRPANLRAGGALSFELINFKSRSVVITVLPAAAIAQTFC